MTTSLKGFYLKRLTLTGPSVPASKIEFARGLNVVVGPSDTGKTYIAQCIDFMLGGSKPLKQIPEAKGYDKSQIQLDTSEGEELVLERSLSGGAFRVLRDGETSTLGEKHDADSKETISGLLLSLAGLSGKKVRTNARGTTRSLSFRDIAHLILVNEEDVIAERSPILTGQHTSKTAEISVFRLLMTGIDDSSLVEQEESKVSKSKQQGKKELLEELLNKSNQEIRDVGLDDITADDVSGALEQADAAVAAASSILSSEQASASKLEEKRKSAWQALRQVESRAAVALELQRRFELLQEQYASDLRRLYAINEAGVRLAQMTEERCPVCGADAEHHDEEHRQASTTPEDVATACVAEIEKIQLLARDLSVTIASNADELEQLETRAQEHQIQLKVAQKTLQDEVQPRVAELVGKFQAADGRRVRLARLMELYRRHDELSHILEGAMKMIPRATKLQFESVGTDEAEGFSKAAEELLLSWNFPNLDRVNFSENDQDLVISARKRSSHGKGVRALTHAAFTLALLRYCRRDKYPHPGLVVIDSPLVVYREPDSSECGEEFHVKDAFYRSVCLEFASDQVIIIENEAPPDDLKSANLVSFTGTEQGRSGFLPRRSALPEEQQ